MKFTKNGKEVDESEILVVGKLVFFKHAEQIKGHAYEVKEIILRGEIVKIVEEGYVEAKLIDNNGFEEDGYFYWFYKGMALSNQDFKELGLLGKWHMPVQSNA